MTLASNTLIQEWLTIASADSSRTCVVDAAGAHSFEELRSRAAVFAKSLSSFARKDLSPLVGLVARPTCDFVAAYLACHETGISVAILPSHDIKSRGPLISTIRPSVVVDGPVVAASPDGVNGFTISPEPFEILFTSGTTSRPKAVVLARSSVCRSTAGINGVIRNQVPESEVISLPLNHSFGIGRLRCCLLAGQRIVLRAATFPYSTFLRELRTFAPCGLAFVPTTIRALLATAHAELRASGESIAYIEVGSERFDLAQRRTLVELCPKARVVVHYGMTEAPRTAMHRLEPFPTSETVGVARKGCRIEIQGDTKESTLGHVGEIVIRGNHVCLGYLRDGATFERIDEEFGLRTRDRGLKDNRGSLYLLGRTDSAFSIGGVIVQPEVVEEAINRLSGIARCHCFARELPRSIRILVAAVQLDASCSITSAEIREASKRYLPPELVPQIVEIVDSIPQTASGKIIRDPNTTQ